MLNIEENEARIIISDNNSKLIFDLSSLSVEVEGQVDYQVFNRMIKLLKRRLRQSKIETTLNFEVEVEDD